MFCSFLSHMSETCYCLLSLAPSLLCLEFFSAYDLCLLFLISCFLCLVFPCPQSSFLGVFLMQGVHSSAPMHACRQRSLLSACVSFNSNMFVVWLQRCTMKWLYSSWQTRWHALQQKTLSTAVYYAQSWWSSLSFYPCFTPK